MTKEIRKEPINKLPSFIFRHGRNAIIKEYIYDYVFDQLQEFGLGHSDLNLKTVELMTEDIISDLHQILSYSDMEKLIEVDEKKTGYIYNKKNKYNLNIILPHIKIKVYIGMCARIARENFNVCNNVGLKDFKDIIAGQRDRGSYRIEVYNIQQGLTISDYLVEHQRYVGLFKRQDEELELRQGAMDLFKNADELMDTLCQYFVDTYYWEWVLLIRHTSNNPEYEFGENDQICYPNDNHTGNFVVVYNGEDDGFETLQQRVRNIDMDQWNTTSLHLMIHNCAIQVLGRMYNRDSYPEEYAHVWLRIYRNDIPLFDRINQFKKAFYEKIGKQEWYREKDLFEYSFWESGVHQTQAITRLYLEEMDRCGYAIPECDKENVDILCKEYNIVRDATTKSKTKKATVVDTKEGVTNE